MAGALYRTTDNFSTFQQVFSAPTNFLLNDFIVLPNGEVSVTSYNKIWSSPNGNAGTFVLSNTGIASNVNFMRLAACSSQPSIRYAMASFSNYLSLYKTVNGGSSWNYRYNRIWSR